MTQHQAPEVTSELLPCPFCGDQAGPEIDGDERQTSQSTVTIFCNGCHASATTEYSYAEAVARWNTRATQPLSLTVDEGVAIARLRELLAKATPLPWVRAVICNIVTKEYHNGMNMQTNLSFKPADPALITEAVNALPALIDRLQSLSLPVDIDRSGLAQEVEEAEMANLIDRVGVLAAMDKLDSAGEQSEFAAGYDAAVRACIEAVENAPAQEDIAAAIRARSIDEGGE